MPLRSLLILLLTVTFAACDASDATGPDADEGHNNSPPIGPGGSGSDDNQDDGSDDDPAYTRAFLSAVIVEAIPMTNPDGSGWDLASGPDLIFEIQDTQGNVLARSTTPQNDLGPSDFPVTWSGNIQVSDWARSYTLHLWDHDAGTAHDYIGAAGAFAIEDSADDYASSIRLQNGSIRARINLRWE